LNVHSAHAADTIPLINAVFPFIDSLDKIGLRSETRNKLKKTREDLDKDIKEYAEKEKKEEVRYFPLCLPFFVSFFPQALDAKAAAKRKAEVERIAKLSPAEQKKVIN
jgi:hypothetical protein